MRQGLVVLVVLAAIAVAGCGSGDQTTVGIQTQVHQAVKKLHKAEELSRATETAVEICATRPGQICQFALKNAEAAVAEFKGH